MILFWLLISFLNSTFCLRMLEYLFSTLHRTRMATVQQQKARSKRCQDEIFLSIFRPQASGWEGGYSKPDQNQNSATNSSDPAQAYQGGQGYGQGGQAYQQEQPAYQQVQPAYQQEQPAYQQEQPPYQQEQPAYQGYQQQDVSKNYLNQDRSSQEVQQPYQAQELQQTYQHESQQPQQPQEAEAAHAEQAQEVREAQEQPEQPLTLDPSGQWYWDWPGQQWLPYYSPPVEQVTRGLEQLTTGQEAQPPQEQEELQQQSHELTQSEQNQRQSLERRQSLEQQHQQQQQEQILQHQLQQEQYQQQQQYQDQYQKQQQDQYQQEQFQKKQAQEQHEIQQQKQEQYQKQEQEQYLKQQEQEQYLKQQEEQYRQPPMSVSQAFESFSQEEEVEARTAAPASPQEQAFVPLVHNQEQVQPVHQEQHQVLTPPQELAHLPELQPAPQQSLAEAPPSTPPGPHPSTWPQQASPYLQGPPREAALIEFSPQAPQVPAEVPQPEGGMGGPPPSLGPPDLVDHGPPHIPLAQGPPQATVGGPPDLTQAPQQPSPSSHDDHYNWYSDQQGGGMPDVTGGPPPPSSLQGGQGRGPDILGQGQGGRGGPSSDRNLYMETGQLEEDDEVVMGGGGEAGALPPMGGPASLPPMVGADSLPPTYGATSLPPMVGAPASLPPSFGAVPRTSLPPAPLEPILLPMGPASLPPMVGGNTPPLQRMVVGSSHAPPAPPPQAREPVEGQQATDPTPAPMVPPPRSLQAPPTLQQPLQAVAEARSEAAGSEHRTAEMMALPPTRPAPLPTPGRDIAGIIFNLWSVSDFWSALSKKVLSRLVQGLFIFLENSFVS